MKIKTAILAALMMSFSSIVGAQNKYRGLQWGVEERADIYGMTNCAMITTNALVGYRFNDRYFLGGALGYGKGRTIYSSYDVPNDYRCVPLFVEGTKYYFMDTEKRNSYFFGADLGIVFQNMTKPFIALNNETNEMDLVETKGVKTMWYAGVNAGLDFAIGKPHIYVSAQLNYMGFGLRAGLHF